MEQKKLNIGLFGFGVVGEGLYKILKQTPSLNATIKRIVIKHPDKQRNAPPEIFTQLANELLNDDEIDIEVKDEPINVKNITMVVIPFLATILMCVFLTKYYFGFFTGFTLWLVYYSKSWNKIMSYIDWELIWIVELVIILGNLVGSYYSVIESYIKQYNEPEYILVVSVISFLSSFMLGSSAKYASIVSLLTSVFGMQYFVLFFTLEYSAYLISPSHKCLPIGQRYFHTGFMTYLKALIIWISLMMTYALLTIL